VFLREETVDEKTLVRIMIAIGGLLFVCSGVFVLVSSIAQFSDPANTSEELESFMARTMLCPAPLMGVGLAFVGAGIIILRRIEEETAESDSDRGSELREPKEAVPEPKK
jgi:hypothetical protein